MTTPDFTIKEITLEEHFARLRKELKDGLYKAVEARCDDIHSECLGMLRYASLGYVQEKLIDILDLVRMYEESEKDDGETGGRTMTDLGSKLAFIRDYECPTEAERQAVSEAISFIEYWSARSKTFENMMNNPEVDDGK